MRDKKNFKRVGLAFLVLVTLTISPSIVQGQWDLWTDSMDYTGGGNATISSDDYLVLDPTTQCNITKPLDVDGGITSDTLDTGHGANELYAMDQDVQTTDSPTFDGLTLTSALDMDSNDIENAFDIECENDLTVKNNMYLQDKLYHLGDLDTYMNINTNQFDFYAGGVNVLDMESDEIEIAVDTILEKNFTVDGYVLSDLLPDPTLSLDLGSGPHRWNFIYVADVNCENVDVSEDVVVTGNVTADTFHGDGSGLTNINGSNITGVLSLENVSVNNISEFTPGYGIHLRDNTTVHENLTVENNITSTNGYFIGDGSLLTGLAGDYWDKSGGVLYPSTSGDDIQINGTLTTTDNITMVGNRLINATKNLTIGNPGDVIFGDDMERDMYPNTTLCMNVGKSTHRFNDLFLGGSLNSIGNASFTYLDIVNGINASDLSVSGDLTVDGNLTFENGEKINNSDDGVIIFSGKHAGGDDLTFNIDFDAYAVGPLLTGSSTDGPGRNIIMLGSEFRMIDNLKYNFGTSNDNALWWYTGGNDGFYMEMVVDGTASRSGNFVIKDTSPCPPYTYPIEINPTLRIQASSTDLHDYISFQHNNQSGVIASGTGINISAPIVNISGDLTVDGTSYLGNLVIEADNISVNNISKVSGTNVTFWDNVTIGEDGDGKNATVYGDTTGNIVSWDANNDALIITDDYANVSLSEEMFNLLKRMDDTSPNTRAADFNLVADSTNGDITNTVSGAFNAHLLLEGNNDFTKLSLGGCKTARNNIQLKGTGTVSLGTVLTTKVNILNNVAGTYTRAQNLNIEPMDAEDGTITLGVGLSCGAPQVDGGTFTEYNHIWIDMDAVETGGTGDTQYGIKFIDKSSSDWANNTDIYSNEDINIEAVTNITLDSNVIVSDNLTVVGTLNASGIVFDGNITPASNDTYNLGAPGLCWNTTWTNNVSSCSPLRLKTAGTTKINITDDIFMYDAVNMTGNIIKDAHTLYFDDPDRSTFGVDPVWGQWGAGNAFGKIWLPSTGLKEYSIGYDYNTERVDFVFGDGCMMDILLGGHLSGSNQYVRLKQSQWSSTSSDNKYYLQNYTTDEEFNMKLYQEGAGKSDAEFNLNTEVDNDVYQDVVLRLQSIWLSGSDSVNFTYDTSEDELIISDANVTINENLTVGDGGVTDYMKINDTGVISLFGDAKRELTLRADLDYTTVTAQGKPTQANIGIFHGYSMPIYNNDNEELFFNENVPGRWDGASDITFHVMVALASAEDVDDTFKFQFSWNQTGETDVVSAGAYDTTDEITVVDGTQYATYMLEFTVDYDIDAGDVMITHDDIAGRLRRVASAGTEIDGEIIVLDWHTHYIVDKMFKPPE